MIHSDLAANEYHSYYSTYINKSGPLSLRETLSTNHLNIISFLESIPEAKESFIYEEGKWTIKEILQHLIDTERVFGYRALCIARGDKTHFPGFEQNDYVDNCNANLRRMDDMVQEYAFQRASTICLFNGFDDKHLTKIGTASNSSLSVRAIGFIIVGHENHHCEIIKERYLKA